MTDRNTAFEQWYLKQCKRVDNETLEESFIEWMNDHKTACKAAWDAALTTAPVTPQQAAAVLLGDELGNRPMREALNPFNKDMDVHEDVTKALKAIAEEPTNDQ